MSDLALPGDVRPIWLDGAFTSQYEVDTLPLLFSNDALFDEYYDAIARKNTHITNALENLRTINAQAREFRASGMWQDCVESLWQCLEIRKELFDSQDFQLCAARRHFIMTLLNFATYFLREGGRGRTGMEEAMFYRSFGLFKRAEEVVNSVEERSERALLKAMIENNFGLYYARRKKYKAASQRLSTAARAFRAYRQSSTGSKNTISKSASSVPVPAQTMESDSDEEPPAMNDEEFKNATEDLYFAVQDGSGDIWCNRFQDGLTKLTAALRAAEKLLAAAATATVASGDQRKASGERPQSGSKRRPSSASSRGGGSRCSSRRSSSASSTKKSPRRRASKTLGDSGALAQSTHREAPVLDNGGFCIQIMHCPIPVDIATVIVLYHNIAAALVGLRNYSAAATYTVKAMNLATVHSGAGGLDAKHPMVVGIRRAKDFCEKMSFVTRPTSQMTASRTAKLLAANGGRRAHKISPGEAAGDAGSMTSSGRGGNIPARGEEDRKSKAVAKEAMTHPRSADAASAYLPKHSPRFKEPTVVEKLQTYLKHLSYRQLVEDYELDDKGKYKNHKASQKKKDDEEHKKRALDRVKERQRLEMEKRAQRRANMSSSQGSSRGNSASSGQRNRHATSPARTASSRSSSESPRSRRRSSSGSRSPAASTPATTSPEATPRRRYSSSAASTPRAANDAAPRAAPTKNDDDASPATNGTRPTSAASSRRSSSRGSTRSTKSTASRRSAFQSPAPTPQKEVPTGKTSEKADESPEKAKPKTPPRPATPEKAEPAESVASEARPPVEDEPHTDVAAGGAASVKSGGGAADTTYGSEFEKDSPPPSPREEAPTKAMEEKTPSPPPEAVGAAKPVATAEQEKPAAVVAPPPPAAAAVDTASTKTAETYDDEFEDDATSPSKSPSSKPKPKQEATDTASIVSKKTADDTYGDDEFDDDFEEDE